MTERTGSVRLGAMTDRSGVRVYPTASRGMIGGCALMAGLMLLAPAFAEAGDDHGAPSWASQGDTRSNLMGDMAGLRPWLDRYGIAFGVTETTELLGNPSGGLKQGAIVEGETEFSLGADLSKTFGLQGAIFNISAFQTHGRGLM